jgi:hypothetical protein
MGTWGRWEIRGDIGKDGDMGTWGIYGDIGGEYVDIEI